VSRIALLDVNVLVALFDPDHVHHEAAHAWFAPSRITGWATCPLTENGFVRVLSNPAYVSEPERPGALLARLRSFCASGGHVFWPDDVTLRGARTLRAGAALSHATLTDVYLLALAVAHGGRLATFDRRIPVSAVTGAEKAHLELIPA
jgi:toxin-antitoxin system PIN domain toxin